MTIFWKVFIAVFASIIVAGGGMYYFESTKAKNNTNDLNSQIALLNSQKSDLQKKSATASTTTTTSTTTTATSASTTTILDPKTVTEKFYTLWENKVANMGSAASILFKITDEDILNQSIYVAPALIQQRKNVLATFTNGTGYDPISCAQIDYQALVVAVEKSKTATNAQEELTIPKFNKTPLTADLQLIDGIWKITKVTCK